MTITLDISKAHLAALRRVFRAPNLGTPVHPRDERLVDALHLHVLAAAETDAAHDAHDAPAGQCRRCGRTDHNGCPQGCGWAEENLCTACLTPAERRRVGKT